MLLALALASGSLASPLATRAAGLTGTTQNDLQQGSACAPNIVVFARGTAETGNVGTLAGPPFFQAMAQQLGGAQNLAVQGVDYPADIPGFLAGGDAAGSQTMAQLTQQAVTQCPQSKVLMAGYSQGSQLVHNAAAMLPADVSSKVAGAVLFGDPSMFAPTHVLQLIQSPSSHIPPPPPAPGPCPPFPLLKTNKKESSC